MNTKLPAEYRRMRTGYDGPQQRVVDIIITKNETQGFWIYDPKQRYNLANYGETERDALLMAIESLQSTNLYLREQLHSATTKLEAIVEVLDTPE